MSSPLPGTRRGSSLVRRLLALEIATVVLAAVIAGGVSAWNTRETIEHDAADKMVAVAVTLASSPGLADAVATRDVPRVQAAAETTRAGTAVSFVTVMDPAGTRLSHPEPARIGETYQGTFLPAAAGETLVETFPGTLGLSVRAIVPVRDAGGTVVGMVAAGQLRVQVADRIARELGILALAAAVAIALGVGLAMVAANRVKRDTLGLEPREITALHRHHQAVMAAMREGLLVLDADSGRVVVLNAEAARLLGLPAALEPSRAAGPTLDELGVDPALRERLADRSPVTDETMLVGERLLLLNRTELEGPAPDIVLTLRDRTELEAMTRELDDARSVTRALRFAAHEHANHLQAVSTLIELGAQDDARELAQRWTRDLLATGDDELRDRLADPALAALVLDKAADARDRGLELRVGEGTALTEAEVGDEQASTDRVTVVGNLVDNALDAALESAHAGRGGVAELDVHAVAGAEVIRVADDGPGLADPDAAFEPGWSTKARGSGERGLGLALVRRVVDRRGGTVEVVPGAEGRGTVFTVTLPPVPSPEDQRSPAGSPPRAR
ncbi:sensor histidine kinase regulating citrate/malate metabolism [Actinomycetospora succinea]|uniref:histidine kinase n=1 Tax=Actinomycetospora succinea TaxID=663603 RepID=A0A4R6VD50_9PSEU|nr:ATP-binding protein [Actinomycetospora succinea]TDQ58501.1 sensor histidine kinase regulating citrate/malate metabolism [Actinomycetospora succinea]